MKSEYFINKELFRKNFITLLEEKYICDFKDTTLQQQYSALVELTKKSLSHNWNICNKREDKKVYTFYNNLDEGKTLLNNLMNLEVKSLVEEVLKDLHINIEELFNVESPLDSDELSLLESSSTLNLNMSAISIKNKDSVWEVEKDIYEYVKIGGDVYFTLENDNLRCCHNNYKIVKTQAYDTPLVGYRSDVINTIRRWECSEYKEYVYISATLQNILKNNIDIDNLYDYVLFNIDERSSLVVIELIRLLIDEHNFSWDKACFITSKCCVYSHKEQCSLDIKYIKESFPRLFLIIEELDARNNYSIINGKINVNKLLSSIFFVIDCIPNNISHRKWCNNINNQLSNILDDYCDDWLDVPSKINLLSKSLFKRKLQKKFRDMRLERKKSFSEAINQFVDIESIFIKIELNNIKPIINLYNTERENGIISKVTFILNTEYDELNNIKLDQNSKINILIVEDTDLLVGAIDIIDNKNLKYLLNGCVHLKDFSSIDKFYNDEVEFNKHAITSVINSNEYISDNILKAYSEEVWGM